MRAIRDNAQILLSAIAVVLVTILAVAFVPVPKPDGVAPDTGVLAVLPFDEVRADDTSLSFSATLQDSLISRLADLGGLKVIAKPSITVFVDSQVPNYLIKDELGATAYLAGTVQQDETRFRIEARLVDAEAGTTIWSNSYNRELTSKSYADVQLDIIEDVSQSLIRDFATADRAKLRRGPTVDLQASQHFYRAKRIFELREVDEYLDATLLALDEALAIEPDYVSALSLKAHVELAQYWYASKGREWIEKANSTLEKAEALAPGDPGVMVVRGYYHYWGFRDYDRAGDTLARAIDLAPNRSDVWELGAYVDRRRARFRDALAYLARARELNPLDIELVTEVIETQATLGALQDTIDLGEEYLRRYPTNYDLVDNMDRMWRLRGEPLKAHAVMMGGVAAPNWGFYSRRMRTALLTQNPTYIEQALSALSQQSNGSLSNFLIEKMYAIDAATIAEREADAQALRMEILARVNKDQPFSFKSDWTPNNFWTPVDVPSYLGDAEAVETIVADYEAQFAPDFWQTARHWSAIARAYARLGKVDQAMDYIERYTTLYGPLSVLRFENNHVYKTVRQSARYEQLLEEARFQLER